MLRTLMGVTISLVLVTLGCIGALIGPVYRTLKNVEKASVHFEQTMQDVRIIAANMEAVTEHAQTASENLAKASETLMAPDGKPKSVWKLLFGKEK